jgi:hypothetical protein
MPKAEIPNRKFSLINNSLILSRRISNNIFSNIGVSNSILALEFPIIS